MRAASTILREITDEHFAWMLGQSAAPDLGLTLPPGGVDTPQMLRIIRDMVRHLHRAGSRGSWLMICDGEAVGLCSYKQAPNAAGSVEIGYGVAAARRRLGHATRAVAAMLEYAGRDPAVLVVTASTAPDNVASFRALERNGFAPAGTIRDPDDGELMSWRRELG